ncbi:MAG: DJ-1/PfpI family protein [Acetobacteraceae bacterium]
MSLHIGLLLFPRVQQLDLTAPYEVLASVPGAVMHLVGRTLEPVSSATGLVLTPTTSFADCPALDVLCIPGGVGVDPLLSDAVVLDFVRRQAAGARYITSVCTGALVLGAAGLLVGRRATTHWNSHDLLAQFGALPGACPRGAGRQPLHRRRRDRRDRLRAHPRGRAGGAGGGGGHPASVRIRAGPALQRRNAGLRAAERAGHGPPAVGAHPAGAGGDHRGHHRAGPRKRVLTAAQTTIVRVRQL